MATQLKDLETNPGNTRPRLVLVPQQSNYDDLKRLEPVMAKHGMHAALPTTLGGIYAAMLISFWTLFVHDGSGALLMTIVTVILGMYFSLMIGGVVLSDSPMPGEQERTFDAFLRGSVGIATGTISGREAMLQMLFLPACMFVLATAIGIIAIMMNFPK